MAGSTIGTIFKITTWGESHGKALGAIVDGCPAGLPLTEEDLQPYLNRRKPGQSSITTPRVETDEVEILSGTFEGITTGAPISLMIRSLNQHSHDYSEIAKTYRPGHADFTYHKKYGHYDYRGGGRSSGRETGARVAAGAIALKILKQLGVDIYAYTNSIGPVYINKNNFNKKEILNNPAAMPDAAAAKKALAHLAKCIEQEDSSGGTIHCVVNNLPIGLGTPVFDKLDACLSKAIMSMGAVKAFEIGDGIEVTKVPGSVNNDAYYLVDEKIRTQTNHAGGILGGISNGEEILIKAHVKPTPSISSTQETVTKSLQEKTINVQGRHDPIIVPRAVVVVESMVAITLLDALFQNMSTTMDQVEHSVSFLRNNETK